MSPIPKRYDHGIEEIGEALDVVPARGARLRAEPDRSHQGGAQVAVEANMTRRGPRRSRADDREGARAVARRSAGRRPRERHAQRVERRDGARAVKTIAILDTETTDVDPSKGHLLEVACVLWSVEHRAVIEARSWLPRERQARSEPSDRRQRHRPRRCSSTATAAGTSKRASRSSLGSTSTPSRLGTPISTAHGSLSIFRRRRIAAGFDAMDWMEWPARSRGRFVATALAHGVGVVDAHRA